MTRAYLFDLDGVLIDTESLYTEFWAEMDRLHPTGVADLPMVIKGNTLERIFTRYFPAPEVQADIRRRIVDYEASMRYRFFPGVVEFLTHLQEHNIPAAVVTSSGEAKMSRLYEQHPQFRGWFKAVITDAQVTRSKPDPQGYLLAAEAVGVPIGECAVIEDSLSGLEAGRRAQAAEVIAMATTLPADTLRPHATRVIASLTELLP